MEKLTKREKVMLGVAVASVAAAGYFGYKYSGVKIKDELSSLKFLVVESDCVQKALQNAENKLSRKETKIKALTDALIKYPKDNEIKAAIIKHEKDAAKLRYQIAKAYELNKRVMNDDIVY